MAQHCDSTSSTLRVAKVFTSRTLLVFFIHLCADNGIRLTVIEKMSKGWVLFAFVVQLVFIVFFYRYFGNTPGSTFVVQETTAANWETVIMPKQSLVDWGTVVQSKQLNTDIDWKKVPRKPSPSNEDMHDKWIVLTTINSPTEDVKKLAKIDGWKVVVVGDTKTPADWR